MGSKYTPRLKRVILLALLASITFAMAKAAVENSVPARTMRFVRYFQATERTGVNVSLIERVMFSLFYASSGHGAKPASTGRMPS
ncbi:MAG TPA: hypothetical protein VM120_26540 [Bryobacteraceae bacterium]|nr:hypothetical protein [Bryobacteraceae bacterium]